jgi:hypothetical protein
VTIHTYQEARYRWYAHTPVRYWVIGVIKAWARPSNRLIGYAKAAYGLLGVCGVPDSSACPIGARVSLARWVAGVTAASHGTRSI